jgi:hypothetical protein
VSFRGTASGGVSDFSDKFFEDVLEGYDSLGLAVCLYDAGEVGTAAPQSCKSGLQARGGWNRFK